MGTSINKTSALYLKNNSGQTVTKGDVVVLDKSLASSFTLTGSQGYVGSQIGVVLDQTNIANGTSCLVAIDGYVPVINLVTGANLGDTFFLSSVTKKAQSHGIILPGDFGQVLSSGLTPDGILWGNTVLVTGTSNGFEGAVYVSSAAQGITGSNVSNILNFDTKESDPNNRVTTGPTWKYTVAVAGYYNISACILFNSFNVATVLFELDLYINNVASKDLYRDAIDSSDTNVVFKRCAGSISVFCNVNDTIQVRISQSNASNRALYPSISENWISIARLG